MRCTDRKLAATSWTVAGSAKSCQAAVRAAGQSARLMKPLRARSGAAAQSRTSARATPS